MSSSEPTQQFSLTEKQLVTLRFVIDRAFTEYFEHAKGRTDTPGDFDVAMVDALMDLGAVFGVEAPR